MKSIVFRNFRLLCARRPRPQGRVAAFFENCLISKVKVVYWTTDVDQSLRILRESQDPFVPSARHPIEGLPLINNLVPTLSIDLSIRCRQSDTALHVFGVSRMLLVTQLPGEHSNQSLPSRQSAHKSIFHVS